MSDRQSTRCPKCGNKYLNLSQHWVMNANCDHPDLTDEQLDVLRNPPDGVWVIENRPVGEDNHRYSGLIIVGKVGAIEALVHIANTLDYLMIHTFRTYIPSGGVGGGEIQHRVQTRRHPAFTGWSDND